MNSRPFGKARDARVAGLTCPRPPACQAGPRPRTRLSRDCRCFSPLGLVALSLLRGGSGRIPASRAHRERGDGRGPRLTKMRIFVVEDEERVACSLQALLLDAGHTPLVVPCVDLALDRFVATPPDAVLLSLHYYFPGMSGFDFLQRERDRKSTRLNSSHPSISYAVFCLKKKKQQQNPHQHPNIKTIQQTKLDERTL